MPKMLIQLMSLLAAISFSLSNNLNIFFTLLLNFPNRLGKSSRTAKIFCMQIQNIFFSVQQYFHDTF